MSDEEAVRERVRTRYASAATAIERGQAAGASSPLCDDGPSLTDSEGRAVFGADLYRRELAQGAPEEAVAASLGCGVPTAVADLHPGETVLDLGSGGGADVLIAARRVGPGGRAIGLDMTPGMLGLARRNAAESGCTNVDLVGGYLEDIPLRAGSIDVVISNCVINLAADKRVVLREAARVLRPGGRLAVSDIIADEDLDETGRAGLGRDTGCIAGALTEQGYRSGLADAGLVQVEIVRTHAVHPNAAAAIIRASKAGSPPG